MGDEAFRYLTAKTPRMPGSVLSEVRRRGPRSLRGLVLFRILPERPVEYAHRHAGLRGEGSTVLGVRPPELVVVYRWRLDADRPEGAVVENRVRLRVAEVQNHGCRRPAHAAQERQHFNAQLFV